MTRRLARETLAIAALIGAGSAVLFLIGGHL
jgi:hypothetical protein